MIYFHLSEVKPMILCLGDSLTRGLVGRSYIKFMPKGLCKNGGLDGDTAHGALRRLRIYRKTPWYGDVDTCVVGIGTNDLLQPYLMGTAPVWRVVFGWRRSWKRWADAAEYELVLREIIETLISDGKRAVLMGLPLMQLRGYPLDKLAERNAVLKRLSDEYGLKFADVYGAELRAAPGARLDYDFGKTGFCRLTDIITMGLFPFTKDFYSRRRGLELTVDGVHFNSFSGEIAAREVEKCL